MYVNMSRDDPLLSHRGLISCILITRPHKYTYSSQLAGGEKYQHEVEECYFRLIATNDSPNVPLPLCHPFSRYSGAV